MGRKRESLLLAGLAAVFTVYHIVSSHHNVEHDLRTHAAHAQSLREKAVRGSTARGAPVRHVESRETRLGNGDIGGVPKGSTKAWLEKRRQKEEGDGTRDGPTREAAEREARRRAAPPAAADADRDDDEDAFTAVRAAVSKSGDVPPAALEDDEEEESAALAAAAAASSTRAADQQRRQREREERERARGAAAEEKEREERKAGPIERRVNALRDRYNRAMGKPLRASDLCQGGVCEPQQHSSGRGSHVRPAAASRGGSSSSATVPQSTEQMAWGVAADANAERADAQARSQGKQKWESEQPSAKEDGNELEDDGSCFQPGFCAPHGVCVKGKCLCVLAYDGPRCKEPRVLPRGLGARFDGQFIITRAHVVEQGGVNFTTNPKAGQPEGHGSTHTLFAPLVEGERETLQRKLNTSLGLHVNPNTLKSVITPSMLDAFDEQDFLKQRIYQRCAIVGNSGLSMIYHDGMRIDAHDAVMRFNSAPTRPRKGRDADATARDAEADFALHVGSRTTMRFINTQHIPWFEGNEVRLQQLQSKTGLFRYLQHKKEHPEARLHAFDTDFTKYVSRNIVNLPTGGYFAVMLALQKCTQVSLYGFHWLAGHSIPHHYFNSEVPLVGKESIHDYAQEHMNIKALAQQNIVQLAQPCVAGCEAESGIKCETCSPGGACGCGDNLPTPLSLPGFCHMKRNYTCFYKCPGGEAECPGGGRFSRCLRRFKPEELRLGCAVEADVPQRVRDEPPLWQRAAWDPKVKAAAAAERGRVERRAAVERGTPAAAAAFKDIPLAE